MDAALNPRQLYVNEMRLLEHEVLEMASRADTMVGEAVDALCMLDEDLVKAVIRSDDAIDQIDLEIENRCLRLLALQQPTASDLRSIGTAMRMIVDIERIGDLAVDIAKCGRKIEREMGESDLVDFRRIAGVARRMLREVMQAFVKGDLGVVREVAELEDEVDALFRDMRGQLHDYMRERPESVVAATWLLLALHHMERIADHTVNIAERVVFMVTGRLMSIREFVATYPDPSLAAIKPTE